MNTGRKRHGFQLGFYGVFLAVVILSVSMMGFASHPQPLLQDPTNTPRPSPTPENTWTTTPTFTATTTNTPVPTETPSVSPVPTNTPRPSDTSEPTSTREHTETPTPTKTTTGTPGLEPVTPIVTPIWVTGAPTYGYVGTRLPISGVEPSDTPSPTAPPTYTLTPVPTLARQPSPTTTPTPTPSDRLGPAAPVGLVATAGNRVVVLEWTPSKDLDLEGYRLYRSSAQGSGYSKMVSVDKKFARYVDNSVTNDVTYYYVVTAFDTAGNESPFSNEVSITPSALKGMPASGATLPETIAESPLMWMGVLTVTLLVLVGVRRRSAPQESGSETEPDEPGDSVEQDSSSENTDQE